MSFLGRWIYGGSLWFAGRLARIFSVTGWLWRSGFQGEKRAVRKDAESGPDVESGQVIEDGEDSNSARDSNNGQDTNSSQDVRCGGEDPATTQPIAVNKVIDDNTETWVIAGKGESIAGGATGLVERLPSGDVVKSPWPSRFHDNHKGMANEAQIYEILGAHPRLVKMVDWDSETCCLTMEYMPNGNLNDYLRAHNDKISLVQRLQWILEAAEGLQLLHSADIMHCDVEPKNFLLDEDLSLRISDFSGSSIKGAQPTAHAGTRFSQPSYDWRYAPTIQDDLFAFGSTIHTIVTGLYPFQEIDSDEVIKRYEAQEWPNVTGILCGGIIERCWRCEIASAQEIYDTIQEKIKTGKIAIPFLAL